MRTRTENRRTGRGWARAGASFGAIGAAHATFKSKGEIFRLSDTACDSHPVFLDYTVLGSRHRVDFSGGCGKSATIKPEHPGEPGHQIQGMCQCPGWLRQVFRDDDRQDLIDPREVSSRPRTPRVVFLPCCADGRGGGWDWLF